MCAYYLAIFQKEIILRFNRNVLNVLIENAESIELLLKCNSFELKREIPFNLKICISSYWIWKFISRASQFTKRNWNSSFQSCNFCARMHVSADKPNTFFEQHHNFQELMNWNVIKPPLNFSFSLHFCFFFAKQKSSGNEWLDSMWEHWQQWH